MAYQIDLKDLSTLWRVVPQSGKINIWVHDGTHEAYVIQRSMGCMGSIGPVGFSHEVHDPHEPSTLRCSGCHMAPRCGDPLRNSSDFRIQTY